MTSLVYDNFTVVIPAFNEGKTAANVISEVLKIKEVSELIFVNDGSDDDTEKRIQKFLKNSRFIYLKHSRNKGKGLALRSGIKKSKNEVILLLDADLKNITALKIRKIALPVLRGEVDFSRGSFDLARGRVTEIAVKPMMKILFPDLYFNQPISGQVCAKKQFLESVNLENRWGVDIGILLDAIEAGQRIVEVNIGRLEHKAQTDQEKAEMAEQVMETMIRKAGLIQRKYRLIIFVLDETLINPGSVKQIYEKLGIILPLEKIQALYEKKKITYREWMTKRAALYLGLKKVAVEEFCQNVPLVQYAPEVIKALQKRKCQIAIISSIFSSIVEPLAKRLGVDIVDCAFLEQKNGKFTGKITPRSIEKWVDVDLDIALSNTLPRILAKTKVKPSEVLLIANSPQCIDIMQKVGFSIAYRPKDKILREIADKTISILPEILAIIE